MAREHKDICFKFDVAGERFEAVGVLTDDEQGIDGYDAMARVPDAIGEEDEVFLRNRLSQLPAELRRYRLVTSRHYSPDDPDSVSYFVRGGLHNTWEQYWDDLHNWWEEDFLVLRRCKKATPGTKAA